MINIVTDEPEWQQHEDRIVGRMIRKLRAYEGQIMRRETFRMMRAIISGSVADAVAYGARDSYVRAVGESLSINGEPFLHLEGLANDPECNFTIEFDR